MTVAPTLPSRPPASAPSPSRSGWTALRIVTVAVGSLLALVALGLVAAGAVATWLTNTQRDSAGYIGTGRHLVSTAGYAITSDRINLGTSADVITPADVYGTLRIRATSTDATKPIFIGVAPSANVESYLLGVSRQVITGWTPFASTYRDKAGTAPAIRPTDATIWTARANGSGTQSVTWPASIGNWTAVIMHADAQPGVAVHADIGASLPDLGRYALLFFLSGVVLLIAAILMIVIPVTRAGH